MKYCKKCVMPDTRPGITFNEEGVCSACQTYTHNAKIDWNKREEELRLLCDKYRGMNGPNGYDCMIAVSGGKDSHFQTYIMKEKMGMNPLLVNVEDLFTTTEAGKHNVANIIETFGCDMISLKLNSQVHRKLVRHNFEKYGKPTYSFDRCIYTYPLHMALKFNTPLLVYGENVSYVYGGVGVNDDTYSAKGQLTNGVGNGIPLEDLLIDGITEKDIFFMNAPSKEDIDRLEPIYLSYFYEWNSVGNFELAKKYGFHDLSHEWKRTSEPNDFDQIDSFGLLLGVWMKYPKFGHARATDVLSRFIRYGLITREEAIPLVKKYDANLDPKTLQDFCRFTGYTEKEVWDIIEKFYNKELFEKDKFGQWQLKWNLG